MKEIEIVTLGKEREKEIIGKWESGERKRGNTNEKKEKTRTERKNEKGTRSYDFQERKIEENIKRRQNEKQVHEREQKRIWNAKNQ